jgi:hypothetical protein
VREHNRHFVSTWAERLAWLTFGVSVYGPRLWAAVALALAVVAFVTWHKVKP